MKYTDEEIKESLRVSSEKTCTNCPYKRHGDGCYIQRTLSFAVIAVRG